jgi:hypothetical protein
MTIVAARVSVGLMMLFHGLKDALQKKHHRTHNAASSPITSL